MITALPKVPNDERAQAIAAHIAEGHWFRLLLGYYRCRPWPRSFAEPPARSVAARQIRAEPADTFVHHDNSAVVGITNIRVVGVAGAFVVAATVSAIVAANVATVIRTVITVDVDGHAIAKRTAIDAKATSVADLDRWTVLRLAEGCDRHRVGRRAIQEAESENQGEQLGHRLFSRYLRHELILDRSFWLG